MGTNGGVESRAGGINDLGIDLTDASGFAGGVTVTCVSAGDVSAVKSSRVHDRFRNCLFQGELVVGNSLASRAPRGRGTATSA